MSLGTTGNQPVADEPTWASCLIVVTAYNDVAPAVSAAVEDVGGRLVLAPSLADFVELRFVSAGPRPPAGAQRNELAGDVATDMITSERAAPENYFGLVAVDDRAAD